MHKHSIVHIVLCLYPFTSFTLIGVRLRVYIGFRHALKMLYRVSRGYVCD